MAATTVDSLIAIVRKHLLEATARFWTDAELIALMNLGAKDLWGAINDNYQQYFVTLDITNVSFAANATSLTGVPTDVFRVEMIEPRDITETSSNANLVFVPKDYKDPDFVSARASAAADPSNRTIYYDIMGAGGPVGAPTIYAAPKVNAAVNLTLLYVPTLTALAAGGNNTVPGESDGALVAWTVAYARAKEREDRSPDGGWLAVYATEKQNMLSRIVPRQTQEDDIAGAIFQPYW